VPQLVRTEILPHYAQVLFFDPTVADSIPISETGTEAVVSTASGLAVFTRPDWMKSSDEVVPVAVEVWIGEHPANFDCVEIWRGQIVVGDQGVQVGSVVGADLHPVELSPGTHTISVLASPQELPDHVVFIVD
jgi:hypothetical protein